MPPNIASFFTVLLVTRLSDHVRARGPFLAACSLIAAAGYVMLLATGNHAVRYAGTFLVAVGVFPCSAMIIVRKISLSPYSLPSLPLPNLYSALLCSIISYSLYRIAAQLSPSPLTSQSVNSLSLKPNENMLTFTCEFFLKKGWLSNNLAPHFVRATGIGFLIAFANTSAFISTFIYLPKDKPDYVLGHSVNLGALILCFLTVCAQMMYLSWENKKRERGDRDDRLLSADDSGSAGVGVSVGVEERLGYNHPSFRYTI